MQGSEAVVPVLSPSPVSVVRRQDTRMTKHTCAPPDTQAAAAIPASLKSAHDDAFEGRVAFLPSRHELSNYARAFCLIRTLSLHIFPHAMKARLPFRISQPREVMRGK